MAYLEHGCRGLARQPNAAGNVANAAAAVRGPDTRVGIRTGFLFSPCGRSARLRNSRYRFASYRRWRGPPLTSGEGRGEGNWNGAGWSGHWNKPICPHPLPLSRNGRGERGNRTRRGDRPHVSPVAHGVCKDSETALTPGPSPILSQATGGRGEESEPSPICSVPAAATPAPDPVLPVAPTADVAQAESGAGLNAAIPSPLQTAFTPGLAPSGSGEENAGAVAIATEESPVCQPGRGVQIAPYPPRKRRRRMRETSPLGRLVGVLVSGLLGLALRHGIGCWVDRTNDFFHIFYKLPPSPPTPFPQAGEGSFEPSPPAPLPPTAARSEGEGRSPPPR